MKQMSTQPFWGVFREVFGVRSYIGALEEPFFGTLKRALLTKVPVLKCQKMAPVAPQYKNGLQKPRKTPPKMVG